VLALAVDAELDHYIKEADDVNCDHGLSFWLERKKRVSAAGPVLQKNWCQLCVHKPMWSMFSQRVAVCARVNVSKHVQA